MKTKNFDTITMKRKAQEKNSKKMLKNQKNS